MGESKKPRFDVEACLRQFDRDHAEMMVTARLAARHETDLAFIALQDAMVGVPRTLMAATLTAENAGRPAGMVADAAGTVLGAAAANVVMGLPAHEATLFMKKMLETMNHCLNDAPTKGVTVRRKQSLREAQS